MASIKNIIDQMQEREDTIQKEAEKAARVAEMQGPKIDALVEEIKEIVRGPTDAPSNPPSPDQMRGSPFKPDSLSDRKKGQLGWSNLHHETPYLLDHQHPVVVEFGEQRAKEIHNAAIADKLGESNGAMDSLIEAGKGVAKKADEWMEILREPVTQVIFKAMALYTPIEHKLGGDKATEMSERSIQHIVSLITEEAF